jgi:deazaflavin-dependent oxidoreductase (nitroreductase family)
MSDFNAMVIAEFRANAGKVGGYFEGADLLLLHTTGARSGQPRLNPLVYARDEERFVVAASKGGADTNPDWYYNLVANPTTTIEVGTEQVPVRAILVTEEPERARLYAQLVAHRAGFGEYEQKTARKIPVILLERIK